MKQCLAAIPIVVCTTVANAQQSEQCRKELADAADNLAAAEAEAQKLQKELYILIDAVGLVEYAPGGEFPKGDVVATAMGNMGRQFDGGYDAEAAGITSAYVFVNERGEPFDRMGVARMIERAGEATKLPFPIHVHMLRHSPGYALAGRGMDTRRLQHYLGHASITNTVRYTAMSPEPFKDIWRD
jgi:Phage integrase family